jgi:tRNA(Glu) U13 pseudouridine synthase TruD
VTTQGVPNYYGPQRLRGENVKVGIALKNGDLKRGTELILEKIQPYLNKGGLESVPKVFWYEKRMFRHLRKYPNDFAGALRRVPKRIRRLYLHAYQSQIFNQQLDQVSSDQHMPPSFTIPGFTIDKMPEMNTIPITRKSLLIVKQFHLLRIAPASIKIRFTLGKGEYASILLLHLLTENRFSSEFLCGTKI